ncbi:MAG: glycosyltransferase family 4 protein [Chloroflexi bacterium]|nr:glycosyltransferase family 4 protein [Chloroflexota bacterium]
MPVVDLPNGVKHPRPKIAFFRKGAIPIANERVAEYLQQKFPEYELDVIDLTLLFEREMRPTFYFNSLQTFFSFAGDLLTQRKKAKEAFWRTRYLFQQIKKLAAERLNPAEYAFSFQMQSLFDASVPGIPHFIYTDHTNLANLSYPAFDPHDLYPPWCIELEHDIYRNAAMVFTRSHNITQSVVAEYRIAAEKVACVYAGSNAPLDNTIQLDNDDYTNQNILFVGIDWERKGGPELVAAFEHLHQRYPHAQLTIVGASPTLHLPNCQVVGRVPIHQVSEYYRKASIFCLPTKLEPFGIAFVEALAHKLPIVGTNIGAIPDFVQDGTNGYLVEPYNVPQLVEALDKLLGDVDRCRGFGEEGNRQAMRRYNWEAVIERMEGHIRPLLA